MTTPPPKSISSRDKMLACFWYSRGALEEAPRRALPGEEAYLSPFSLKAGGASRRAQDPSCSLAAANRRPTDAAASVTGAAHRRGESLEGPPRLKECFEGPPDQRQQGPPEPARREASALRKALFKASATLEGPPMGLVSCEGPPRGSAESSS